jgi:hypothetical protein
MEVDLLISTMNREDLLFLEDIYSELGFTPKTVIVNQSIVGKRILEDSKYKIINSNELGLSRSRNLAIQNAVHDIGVIADDDVKFLTGFDDKVKYYHSIYPDYSILIFKVISDNGKDFRKYFDGIKDIDIYRAMNVCSIEITFKRKDIIEKNIKFDEGFGLGAKIESGEEWVFLSDAILKGLKVKFIPEYIVFHGVNSTGDKFNKDRIIGLGVTIRRALKFRFLFFIFYFLLKFRHKSNTGLRRLSFIYYLLLGAFFKKS